MTHPRRLWSSRIFEKEGRMDTRLDGAAADAEFKEPVIHRDGVHGAALPGESGPELAAAADMRSWANEHWRAIARDMGRSLAAVRSMPSRLGISSIDAAPPPGQSRRRRLKIGASVATVALLAGGTVGAVLFAVAPPPVPSGRVPQAKDAFVGMQAPPPVAPASRLATVPVAEDAAGPTKPGPIVVSHDAEVAEVRSFKPVDASPEAVAAAPASGAVVTPASSSPAAATPSREAPVPSAPSPSAASTSATADASSAPLPQEVGVAAPVAPPTVVSSPPAAAPGDGTPAAAAPLPVAPGAAREADGSAPAMASPAAVDREQSAVAPVSPARPKDAVEQVAALQADPMTDAQQIQVLSLVTELGRLVRDVRTEVASLREDQERLGRTTIDELGDFSRRLSVAEANWPVSAAMANAAHSLMQADAAQIRDEHVAAGPVAAPAAGSTALGSSATPVAHRYRVQAASPGLAMLAEVTAAGVERRQVAVGDVVPGYGRILRIAQRGAVWVVVTDKGTIE
jgi:hypothetical protein